MSNFSKLILPLAIIIAGAFIAFGVYHSGGPAKVAPGPSAEDQQKKSAEYIASLDIAPVTDADHIQGDPNAKVTIVEYSDTECPYCKAFHQVLTEIFNDYNIAATSTVSAKNKSAPAKVASVAAASSTSATNNTSGASNKVAWVYRQFPLVELHTKAPKEAEATECANELGGSSIFWKYLSTVFTNTPSNDGLDPAQLLVFADQVGLDKNAFASCLNSGKYTAKISEAILTGKRAGADATPYTVILVKTGAAADGTGGKIERVPLIGPDGSSLGNLPYASMKAIIERLLNS